MLFFANMYDREQLKTVQWEVEKARLQLRKEVLFQMMPTF
jgi:hypothetical protein